MLQLEDLVVQLSRKSRPLFSINSVHEPGTLTWIRGASGSGKTTLLRVVCGLQKPTSGTVNIFGNNCGALLKRTEIGFERSQWELSFKIPA
ncbi:ATP-binding cassette domain-containing protein [Corynebacterium sp. MSK073]|uniref:ABC transporter ATP-binding protein n=1 Tax=Corynebacterium sp. MSK073 TaxID=3050198 RepID=UPI003307302A